MNQDKYNLIAIDVAKDSLQIQSAQRGWQVPYNKDGLAGLIEAISEPKRPWVVCEATGGYEQALLESLHEKRIRVSLVNPARVRAFAKSEGLQAKTDPIDARVLLRFAQEKELRARPVPEPKRQKLAALLDRRSQLSEQLAREKNRLHKSTIVITASIERVISLIKEEIESIDQAITTLIAEDEDLQNNRDRLQSVKGVGELTALTLLAYLAEMTQVSRNQLVALAGLAPFNRDSGKRKAKRAIQGGRAKVRKCLYMAARSAAKHNPVIRDYVNGLKKRGKPYKCAIVAAMRKLLIHLQSILKNPQKKLA